MIVEFRGAPGRRIDLMSKITCVLLSAATLAAPLWSQKKAEPKPESAPAEAAFPVDPELQKELDAIATDVGGKMNCVPGRNFDVAGTINSTQLQLLMEVADRAFRIFEEITADAGGVAGERVTGQTNAPGRSPAEKLFAGRKCLILVFNNSSQYKAFGKWYEGHHKWPVLDAMKSVSYIPIAYPRCIIASHLKPLDINMMRNVVAHEIGHMCGYRFAYNNNFSPVWFVEGLATVIEGRTMGTTSCYCFSGGYGDASDQSKNLVNREWSKWKAQVKAMMKAKQDKAMAHILPMQLNELTLNETGKSMAVADYWMKTEPAKLMRWLALTKKYWPPKPQYEWEAAKGEAQKRALKEVFDMDWPALDEAVRKYVQTNY
jgi:hypothetical protein